MRSAVVSSAMLSIVARSMSCRSLLSSGRFERAREADAITGQTCGCALQTWRRPECPSRRGGTLEVGTELPVRLREPHSPRATRSGSSTAVLIMVRPLHLRWRHHSFPRHRQAGPTEPRRAALHEPQRGSRRHWKASAAVCPMGLAVSWQFQPRSFDRRCGPAGDFVFRARAIRRPRRCSHSPKPDYCPAPYSRRLVCRDHGYQGACSRGSII